MTENANTNFLVTWFILYLGELLVVDVLDVGGLLGGGGEFLLQTAILQLQAPHILNVGSKPEEGFNLRKLFQPFNK